VLSPLGMVVHRKDGFAWARIGCETLCLAALGAGCAHPESFHKTAGDQNGGVPVTCHVSRSECGTAPFAGGLVNCPGAPLQQLSATTCAVGDPTQACKDAFCSADATDPYHFDTCTVDSAETAAFPSRGVCNTDITTDGFAKVDFFDRSRVCDSDTCDIRERDETACVDTSARPALKAIAPPTDELLGTVLLTGFEANSPDCTAETSPAPVPPSFGLTYALHPGPLGTVTAAGAQTNLSVTNGTVSIGQNCFDGTCSRVSLNSFRANVANVTVAGTPLTNLSLQNAFVAPLTDIPDPDGPRLGIPAGTLRLLLDGNIAGQHTSFTIENDTDLPVDVGTAGVSIAGAFHVYGLDPLRRPVPVTFVSNVHGDPATDREVACALANGQARLFGFEAANGWNSAQASLSIVSSPVTQGCGALAVAGQNYMTITGGTFSTRHLTVAAALSVDLFIPPNQPNPSWQGALQAFLTCPSAGANNLYLGQAELTGKPKNQFSTLRFPLPSAASSALRRPLDDCSFTFGLNVNATGQSWVLDNVRFTP
jgi:hypothetical protein